MRRIGLFSSDVKRSDAEGWLIEKCWENGEVRAKLIEFINFNCRADLLKLMIKEHNFEIDETFKQNWFLNVVRKMVRGNEISPYYSYKRDLNWEISLESKKKALKLARFKGRIEIMKFLIKEFAFKRAKVMKKNLKILILTNLFILINRIK